MYKKTFYVCLFLVVLAAIPMLWGCGESTTDRAHFQSGYFDVRQYINGVIDRLNKKDPLVEKAAYLNGKEEHHELHFDQKKWQTELAPFLDADINKPAFVKRYRADTLKIDDSTSCLVYSALDEKLRTRELKLYFHRNIAVPYKLEAQLSASKLFYKSAQRLRLTESEGYDLRGRQDIVLFGTDTFAIKGKFE